MSRPTGADDPPPTLNPRPDAAIFFTGFPGFIGARLLPRILELRPETRIACLVQERFAELARRQIRAEHTNPVVA